MSATISKGYTFGSTELVTNAKLHSLVESATITGIDTGDIAAGASIASSQLAGAIPEVKLDITSAPVSDYLMRYDGSKLDWVSQTSLLSISSGSSSFSTSFTNGSLVSYLCSISHGLSNQYCNVTVWDENGLKALPDVTAQDGNNILLDFTGFGSLVSIWNVGVI